VNTALPAGAVDVGTTLVHVINIPSWDNVL